MKIVNGRQARPRRILKYGIHGWGKSTIAAHAPKPIFLNIEDGLGDIDCAKTEQLKTFPDVLAALMWLGESEHDFSTVVIDTLDWLEQLIFKSVALEAKVENIEKIGYGKGYKMAVAKWQQLLEYLNFLRLSRNMTIILLAHAKIDTFESPESDRYDRYEPDLHEAASSLIQEWCDEVFFLSFQVNTVSEDMGFNKTRSRATGGKERIIKTQESAAALAKNRLCLPERIVVESPDGFWKLMAGYLPPIGQSPTPVVTTQPIVPAADVTSGPLVDFPPNDDAGNIEGLVLDGSSKKAQQAKEAAVA